MCMRIYGEQVSAKILLLPLYMYILLILFRIYIIKYLYMYI